MDSLTTEGPKRVPPEKNRGGEWITFGDEQYRVPALGFRAIQDLQARIAQLAAGADGGPSPSQMDTIIDVVHAAMQRNYPKLPREEVADMVDLANCAEVLGAVLRISGFTRRAGGPSSGEALTASTGTSSTPS